MKNVLRLLIFLIALLSFSPAAIYAKDLAIIVNPKNPIDDLAWKDLVKVFKLEKKYWEGAEIIYPILRETGSYEKELALKKIYRTSDGGLKKLWMDKIYREEISEFPKVLDSTETVIRFVGQVPNAIGFIDASQLDTRIKALRIDGLLPGEKGYPLRDD